MVEDLHNGVVAAQHLDPKYGFLGVPKIALVQLDSRFCATVIASPITGNILVYLDPLSCPVELKVPPLTSQQEETFKDTIDPIIGIATCESSVMIASRYRLFVLDLGIPEVHASYVFRSSNTNATIMEGNYYPGYNESNIQLSLHSVDHRRGAKESLFVSLTRKISVFGDTSARHNLGITTHNKKFYLLTSETVECWMASPSQGDQLGSRNFQAGNVDLDSTFDLNPYHTANVHWQGYKPNSLAGFAVNDDSVILSWRMMNATTGQKKTTCCVYEKPFAGNSTPIWQWLQTDRAVTGIASISRRVQIALFSSGFEILDMQNNYQEVVEWRAHECMLISGAKPSPSSSISQPSFYLLDLTMGLLEFTAIPSTIQSKGFVSQSSKDGGVSFVKFSSRVQLENLVYFGRKASPQLKLQVSDEDIINFSKVLMDEPEYVDPTVMKELQQKSFLVNLICILHETDRVTTLSSEDAQDLFFSYLSMTWNTALCVLSSTDEFPEQLARDSSLAMSKDRICHLAASAESYVEKSPHDLHFVVNTAMRALASVAASREVHAIAAQLGLMHNLWAFVHGDALVNHIALMLDFITNPHSNLKGELQSLLGEDVYQLLYRVGELLPHGAPLKEQAIGLWESCILRYFDIRPLDALKLAEEHAVRLCSSIAMEGSPIGSHPAKLLAKLLALPGAPGAVHGSLDELIKECLTNLPSQCNLVAEYLTALIEANDLERALAFGVSYPAQFEELLESQPPSLLAGLYFLQCDDPPLIRQGLSQLINVAPTLKSQSARSDLLSICFVALAALGEIASSQGILVNAYLTLNDLQTYAMGNLKNANVHAEVLKYHSGGLVMPIQWLLDYTHFHQFPDLLRSLRVLPMPENERIAMCQRAWCRALVLAAESTMSRELILRTLDDMLDENRVLQEWITRDYTFEIPDHWKQEILSHYNPKSGHRKEAQDLIEGELSMLGESLEDPLLMDWVERNLDSYRRFSTETPMN
jgi:pimeloyl-ACP methyl ester carboxylesterase